MKLWELFPFQSRAHSVQTARRDNHPYEGWLGHTPLHAPEHRLYDAIREGVPLIDAALDKIVRLTGGFRVECEEPEMQKELDRFVEEVQVGYSCCGLSQFVSAYLDSLLTYGNAVGEIVPDSGFSEIRALYNARLGDVHIRRGKSPLELEICAARGALDFVPVTYPQLVLFTPLCPPAGEIKGVSLLRSLPFVSSILLKIYHSIGNNFERLGNLRYAVTYKPGSSALDKAHAQQIAQNIAREWADAMNSQKNGAIKDFVAVGDVEVRVIGAENQMISTEIPVRQMLEQMVAKLGIPPFMLGLHWSSTERMSIQQADILTSELESYRRLLNPVILRVCRLFLRLRGSGAEARVVWDNINLQDELEAAEARLKNARALSLEAGHEKPEVKNR